MEFSSTTGGTVVSGVYGTHPVEQDWDRRASQYLNSPAKLSIGVGYGVKPIELGKCVGVSQCSSFTNGLGVGTSHVSVV